MRYLAKAGRIFLGVAVAEVGLQAIYTQRLPYILAMPQHFWKLGSIALAYILGVVFTLAGASMIFEKKTRQVSLLFGALLLLIFCFYYIPSELAGPNYMHLADWENAEKELAFAGGALVIAGCCAKADETKLIHFLGKLIPFGGILFAITLISFGILHFLYTRDASTLVPTWIPCPMFWTYFAGVALIGSGVGMILKIKVSLIAALAGIMMLLWFILLHISRIVTAPAVYLASEITSAFLALAYSGIAFAISGDAYKKSL